MDRRHFLAASGAGASTLLAGCTVDNPLAQIAGEGVLRDLGGVLQSAAVSGLGGTAGANNASRERLGPEANQAAFAAYGEVFNQIHRAPNPSTVVLPTAQVSLGQSGATHTCCHSAHRQPAGRHQRYSDGASMGLHGANGQSPQPPASTC